jgi:hypothetical protein
MAVVSGIAASCPESGIAKCLVPEVIGSTVSDLRGAASGL